MKTLLTVRSTVPVILLAALAAAGCSSSRTTAKNATPTAPGSPSSTSVPVRVTDAPSPMRAAQVLARKMVAEAVLPPGARRSTAPLPPLLRGPFETPSGSNLVKSNQPWTIPESSVALVEFLKNNAPAGFQGGGVGSSGSPTEHTSEIVESATTQAPNVSNAMLEIRVEASGADASIVNVVAVVQWTPRRPANERVGTGDKAVVIDVQRMFEPGKPVVRRVVVTDRASVGRIVNAFNALAVAAVGATSGCFELGQKAVDYRVMFATSATATPDVVATIAPCSSVGVTVGGRSSISLDVGTFGPAVARALGQPELTFG